MRTALVSISLACALATAACDERFISADTDSLHSSGGASNLGGSESNALTGGRASVDPTDGGDSLGGESSTGGDASSGGAASTGGDASSGGAASGGSAATGGASTGGASTGGASSADSDGDGVLDDADVCPGHDDKQDWNGNGHADECEPGWCRKNGGADELLCTYSDGYHQDYCTTVWVLLTPPGGCVSCPSKRYDCNGNGADGCEVYKTTGGHPCPPGGD